MARHGFAIRSTLLSSLLVIAAGLASASTHTGAPSAQGGASSGASAVGKDQSSQSGTKEAGSAEKSKDAKAPVYLLIPVQVAQRDNSMKSGCWAKVYGANNYDGDSLTLVGPVDMADMSGPFGLDWDDKVKSIETGKKATVTVYDNEGFKDQVAQFKPGQKIPDVSKRMGFFDEFASVKISC